MKDQTEGPRICQIEAKDLYVFGIWNSDSKHKKGLNGNFFATISHCEYKDVLLNKKCLRH